MSKEELKQKRNFLKGYKRRLKTAQAVTTPLYKKLPLVTDKDFQDLACIEATFEEFLYAGERIRGEFRKCARQLKKGDDDEASTLLINFYQMFSHLKWHCEEAWQAALDLPTKQRKNQKEREKNK
jgi:hypothetical protein